MAKEGNIGHCLWESCAGDGTVLYVTEAQHVCYFEEKSIIKIKIKKY